MNKIVLILSVIISLGLIGGGIYVSSRNQPAPAPAENQADVSKIFPITADEHRQGSPDATITIVEYSDIDCPFCKEFHKTMQRIIDTYGKEGKVAWVYRNFPITSLHPNARRHAVAAECVAKLGGNAAYWKFLSILFAEAPGNNRTDPSRYGEFAQRVGVDSTDLQTCIDTDNLGEKVDKQRAEALAAGAQGTPFSIIVKAGQPPIVASGLIPYEQLKSSLDQLLRQ